MLGGGRRLCWKKGTQTSDIIFALVTLQTSNIISHECYFQQIQLTSKWLLIAPNSGLEIDIGVGVKAA